MEADDIINEKYYEKDSYNIFDNFSIHGLNIEGIKRYCLNPVNKKYYHMVKMNKDLDELFKKDKIEKEKRKKNIKSNIYDEERLYKMYSTKKGENKNKMIKPVIKEININNIKDSDNTNKINRSELKQKILNISPNQLTENPIKIDKKNFRSFSINKNNSRKNFYQTNMSYSLRKFKKLKKNKKMSLPFIKPREIIIEYQLTNGSGANQDNKNLGHNGYGYMGASFNPQNYTVTSKNRTKRNVFGGLFVN